MIVECYNCGKRISNRIDTCPFCSSALTGSDVPHTHYSGDVEEKSPGLQERKNAAKGALIVALASTALAVITFGQLYSLERGNVQSARVWALSAALYEVGGKFLAVLPFAAIAVGAVWVWTQTHRSSGRQDSL